jgi:type I restriction enzyme S subunit
VILRRKGGGSDHFFRHFFKSDRYIQQLTRNIEGMRDGKMVSYAQFSEQLLSVPEPPEQQKIADCLGSLDDLIAAEGRKLQTLRQHKQALMQRLFPLPGETVPRLRFPEFRNAGEWEEEKLDDLAKRGTGHTPNKAIAEYYNGGIKWVSLADSKRPDHGLISETAIEISEEGIKNSSAVLHPAGSVILSRDAGVGKSAIISCAMAVSQHFIVWTCDPAILSNWFLYHQLQLLKPLFEQVATGLPFFNAMQITVTRIPEQQQIAACLSLLDETLAAQSRKVEGLKAHKRGLLQQLFPSPGGNE